MPLEDPSRIDMVTTEGNRVSLVITDAGLTVDPGERLTLLKGKLRGYARWVKSRAFKEQFPGRRARDVEILAMCRNEPTPEMIAINRVRLAGGKGSLSVRYEIFAGAGD